MICYTNNKPNFHSIWGNCCKYIIPDFLKMSRNNFGQSRVTKPIEILTAKGDKIKENIDSVLAEMTHSHTLLSKLYETG